MIAAISARKPTWRLVNILWWVWLAATLVALGYFATLGIGAMQHGVGVSK
jgi:hypothetical protein